MGKELWTAVQGGDPIRVYAAFNERDEADFVIDRIREHQRRGLPLASAAVLYRSNAQSRAFEETLMAARIPYRVYGGLRFFERAEIKDALAYLRLTQSRDDDIAFERVVNLPTRGIGGATLDLLRADARDGNRSLWKAGLALMDALPARAAGALRGFYALIDRLAAATCRAPAARAGGARDPALGPARPPREGEGQQGRSARREPRRARERRGGLPARERRGPLAARRPSLRMRRSSRARRRRPPDSTACSS